MIQALYWRCWRTKSNCSELANFEGTERQQQTLSVYSVVLCVLVGRRYNNKSSDTTQRRTVRQIFPTSAQDLVIHQSLPYSITHPVSTVTVAVITRKPGWRKGKRPTAVRAWRPATKKFTANQLSLQRESKIETRYSSPYPC